ncbi:MAG: TrmH family RNA methyltransferase [Pyrinomonadaceae bacterium]
MREISKITSRDNRRLVHARKVRDGKEREQIFIEGRRLVNEALSSSLLIDECFVTDDFNDYELLKAISDRTEIIAQIPARIFASIADTDQSQGIILLAKRPIAVTEFSLTDAILPIVVFLKEINNPSNLGAVLRAALAAGVSGVLVSTNSADVYSPKALRSAMGATFRLPIWDNADSEDVLSWAKTKKMITTAADVSAPKSYIEIDWTAPRLLILGSEAHGLTDEELAGVNEKINIPMTNHVESLNLAVSAGIILFEAKRQNELRAETRV